MKQTNGIHPRIQATINRIVLRNIERLDVTREQRAAIVVVLLEPSLSKKALRRMGQHRRRKMVS
jgi:hypothetical protein